MEDCALPPPFRGSPGRLSICLWPDLFGVGRVFPPLPLSPLGASLDTHFSGTGIPSPGGSSQLAVVPRLVLCSLCRVWVEIGWLVRQVDRKQHGAGEGGQSESGTQDSDSGNEGGIEERVLAMEFNRTGCKSYLITSLLCVLGHKAYYISLSLDFFTCKMGK